MTTPAYITVDGQTVGKLEFGDDPERQVFMILTLI